VPVKRPAKKPVKRQSSTTYAPKRKVDPESAEDLDVKRIKAEPDPIGSGADDDHGGSDLEGGADGGNDDDDFDSFNQGWIDFTKLYFGPLLSG
jgi:hypothetical protein